jgi:CheY-like chemotaxis protein
MVRQTLKRTAMPRRSVNLLLVEDDELVALCIVRAFRGLESVSEVMHARDGIEALGLLRSGQIGRERLVILLDLNMPRMDGIEFLRHLRADPDLAPVPVVVLTTSDAAADRARAWGLHAAGYILKPTSYDALRDCLRCVEQYWSIVEFPSMVEFSHP